MSIPAVAPGCLFCQCIRIRCEKYLSEPGREVNCLSLQPDRLSMRYLYALMFIHVSLLAGAQKVEFRNDSLFINACYVDGATSKSTMDSLLGDKGKLKKVTGKHIPGTTEVAKWTKVTYSKSGLIFTKSDDDSSKLLLAIKLYKNRNPEVDQNNMPTKAFTGSFFIDSNYMNDKKRVEDLQGLSNCHVNCQESSFAGRTGLIFCDILYQKRGIRALFDFQTNELSCVFID